MFQESTNIPRLLTRNSHNRRVFNSRIHSGYHIPLVNKQTLAQSYSDRYLTPKPRSQYSQSPVSFTSLNSTLAESPSYFSESGSDISAFSSPGFFGKPCSHDKASLLLKIHAKRGGSFHLIIPLDFIYRGYVPIKNFIDNVYHSLINSFEECSEFLLNMFSIVYISVFSTFGIDILRFGHSFFFFGILLFQLISYKIVTSESVCIFLRGSHRLNDKSTLDNTARSMISHVVLGYQIFSSCFMLKMASVFKSQHMDKTSRLDHLSLIFLLAYMMFVFLNIFQHSIHRALHYATNAKYGPDSPIVSRTALSFI